MKSLSVAIRMKAVHLYPLVVQFVNLIGVSLRFKRPRERGRTNAICFLASYLRKQALCYITDPGSAGGDKGIKSFSILAMSCFSSSS